MCRRPNDAKAEAEAAARRLEFEVAQLTDELKETDELLDVMAMETDRLLFEQMHTEEELTRVRTSLRPIRVAAASVLPPELTLLDQKSGRL